MTLTAINVSHDLLCPWAMIENEGFDSVSVRVALEGEGDLFCPHCFRAHGQLVPVRYRSGSENRKPHFFHKSEEEGDHQCANYSGESDKHLNAKSWIAENLKRKNQGKGTKIEVDRVYLRSLDGRKRKPDILEIYGNGSKIAHEIQVSPITLDLLKLRTEDLLNECGIVVWWLYRSVYRDEIRSYLAALPSVQFKHFWFSEEDFKFCEGSATEVDKKKKQPSGSDRCSRLESKYEKEQVLRDIRERKEQEWAIAQSKSLGHSVRSNKPVEEDFSDLFNWFLSLQEDQLIEPPFYLYPHQKVLGSKFYEALRFETSGAIAGERPPRLRTGALIKDLKRLKELINEQSSDSSDDF